MSRDLTTLGVILTLGATMCRMLAIVLRRSA
jgi:hypothetical protein